MRLLPSLNLSPPVKVLFVPTDRFFLRLVPLAPDLPVAGQVELALEGLAPFPMAQLYWGFCVAPDRTQALVYAAHRRRFQPEEVQAWAGADLVVPDLLVLLGAAPAKPTLLVHAGNDRLGGVAWSGKTPWPSAVHARACVEPPAEEARARFAAELAARAGLDGEPANFVSGAPRARREGDSLVLELVDAAGTVLAATTVAHADLDGMDMRDRVFLARRRRDQRRGELIWKVLISGSAAAALALVFDTGALTLGLVNRFVRPRITAQAPLVQELEIAHSLASRVDELTHRRLRFFEMLAAINEPRPRSIQFTRTGTNGQHGLEIEAQTNSAGDVSTYETALRGLSALEKVDLRIRGTRDGMTTFALSVAFKLEPAAGHGGAP